MSKFKVINITITKLLSQGDPYGILNVNILLSMLQKIWPKLKFCDRLIDKQIDKQAPWNLIIFVKEKETLKCTTVSNNLSLNTGIYNAFQNKKGLFHSPFFSYENEKSVV